jgi:hypothetical protein
MQCAKVVDTYRVRVLVYTADIKVLNEQVQAWFVRGKGKD